MQSLDRIYIYILQVLLRVYRVAYTSPNGTYIYIYVFPNTCSLCILELRVSARATAYTHKMRGRRVAPAQRQHVKLQHEPARIHCGMCRGNLLVSWATCVCVICVRVCVFFIAFASVLNLKDGLRVCKHIAKLYKRQTKEFATYLCGNRIIRATLWQYIYIYKDTRGIYLLELHSYHLNKQSLRWRFFCVTYFSIHRAKWLSLFRAWAFSLDGKSVYFFLQFLVLCHQSTITHSSTRLCVAFQLPRNARHIRAHRPETAKRARALEYSL